MKAKLWMLFAVVCVGMGWFLYAQTRTIKKQKQFIETLQIGVEKGESKKASVSPEVEQVKRENLQLRGQLTAAEVELNQTRAAYGAALQMTNAPGLASATAGRGGKAAANPMSAIAELMKDPEMKKAMAQQQRAMMDMMYGGLFKQLQLTPEETEKLKDLLLDQQMTAMSEGMGMFSQTNSADRAEIGKKLAEQQKQKEEEIRAFLGDDKFQEYKDYTATMGERMALEQFAKQSDAKPEQLEQLLALMKEEKQNAQINQPVIENFDPNTDWQKLMESDELMQRQMAQQEQVNNNVLERAREILTPEQFTKFEAHLKSQLAMQQLGLKMARKMMTPEAEPPGAVPEVQK